MTNILVATFYHFTPLEDPQSLRVPLREMLAQLNVKGTILVATEGINGTIAGQSGGINAALKLLRSLPGNKTMEHKISYATTMPFYRLKVRVKKEIVTMNVPDLDPRKSSGTYVAPADWNDLITNENTYLIDARNEFEIKIGTFEGAINPKTTKFSELPQWFENHRAELENKKVAMFCTGGIRCEKATSYLKDRGIKEVFHLKGGILKYLEDIPEAESQWHGECFVFDGRVSVKHNLKPGEYEQCHACRSPIDPSGRESVNFIVGISCDNCIDQRTDAQRARYAARQDQVKRAAQRGESHIGVIYNSDKDLTNPYEEGK